MARSSDGATVVNLDVNFIRWGPRDKPPGLLGATLGLLAIPPIVIGASMPMSTWTAAGAGAFTALGVGVLADGLVAMTPTMNAEAVWQATIVTNDRVVMKLQEPVYIRSPDIPLYTKEVSVSPISSWSSGRPLRLRTVRYDHNAASCGMKNTIRRCAFVGSLSLALAGCVDPPGPATSSITEGPSPYMRGGRGSLTYRAVDLMLASAPSVTTDTPLIVASISDAQHLETSSALGNIVSDMIRTRVVQDGHSASELRLRSAINFNRGEGEFLLSRNRHALMPAPSAAAIVTGTYAAGSDTLNVRLKLVSASDAHIISAADFVMPLRDVWALLTTRDLAPVGLRSQSRRRH